MATKTKTRTSDAIVQRTRPRPIRTQEPTNQPVESPPSQRWLTWERAGAATGIAFVAVLIASFAVVPYQLPKGGDAINEVTAFFASHRTGMLVSTYLGTASLGLFLWFLGTVRAELRHGNERLAAIAYGGGIAGAALVANTLAYPAALASVSGVLDNADSARILFALWQVTDKIAAFGMAVFVAAASLTMVRSGIVGKRLGWIGCGISLAIVSYGGGIVVDRGALALNDVIGFVTLGCFALWTVALSVMLVRRPPHDSRTVPKHV